MFRALTVISVVAAIAVVVKFGKQLAGQSAGSSVRPRIGRYPLIEALIAFVMWASLLVLIATGFLGATMLGHALSGFTTLIHVGCGAVFALSLAVLAVFRAEAYSLAGPDTFGRFSLVQKICFWVIVICGLGLIFSVLSAMFPILATDGQHMATRVHKLSALVALVATIIYAGTAGKRN
ncbi:MAG: hypothetical protein A2283_13905 [Lentisphaerae bacterium RIFOXYA12_FULL_48_11]|nr:MAG: hypothetical protein A2283_13905 [Lentisphaerae bacterium RIFOXYA12_FULL_48_11]